MPPQSHNPKGCSNQTTIELFNYCHFSLRDIIKRSFESLKIHFFILRYMPSFTSRKQAHIVITCAIHNYIYDQDMRDKNFFLYEDSGHLFGLTQDDIKDDIQIEKGTEINMLSESIVNKMANNDNMSEIRQIFVLGNRNFILLSKEFLSRDKKFCVIIICVSLLRNSSREQTQKNIFLTLNCFQE